jgi:hypothetical protein
MDLVEVLDRVDGSDNCLVDEVFLLDPVGIDFLSREDQLRLLECDAEPRLDGGESRLLDLVALDFVGTVCSCDE